MVINVSKYHCDVLILKKCRLQTSQLSGLDSKDVQACAVILKRSEQQLLEWLWDTIEKSVLDALRFIQVLSGSWPQIWWILTESLTKFSLYAAENHSHNFCNMILNWVISSYSSSIQALIQSHQRHLRVKMTLKVNKTILIDMKMMSDQNHLQYVLKKIAKLSHLCWSMQLNITIPSAHWYNVLSVLQDCRIFHFADHGLTHPSDPSKSSLVLSDEQFTVKSLFKLNLHNCVSFLAYLSACRTGKMKHNNLIDEALHLISTCQLTSFQHVISMLWKVNDQSCVEMMAMTYEWMKWENISNNSVTKGLHQMSHHLCSQWNLKSAVCTSKCMAIIHTEGGSAAMKQSHSSQATTRDSRTAELYKNLLLYWISYVHFRI